MKKTLILLLVLALAAPLSAAGAKKAPKQKTAIWEWMQANSAPAVTCSGDIWAHPELGEQEKYSSERLARYLEENGFTIERGVAGIPTAWVAAFTNGTGGPSIGYLAEFDALPGLSQKAFSPVREPLVKGGPGHGCGHSLLGVATSFAAVGVKKAMQDNNIQGTLRVYGCPAEETLVGKIYMARAGVFNATQAMLGWHPSSENEVSYSSALAMTSIKFKFYGRTAHAAGDPHHGRSALDAVELMNTGVNYMREHVTDKARVHYVITSGGGAPNVVPDVAEVWYFVRAQKTEEQRPILEWVRQIAAAAAQMTQTRMEENLLSSCYEVLLNDPLALMLQTNLELVGPPRFDQADWEFAREISKTFEKPDSIPLDTTITKLEIVPQEKWFFGSGSTDDADVSWCVPYGRIATACNVKGAPGHSWQTVSASGSPVGMKGMIVAAKVMAGGGIDLLTDPSWIDKAKADFTKQLKGRVYKCGVPDSLPPPSQR